MSDISVNAAMRQRKRKNNVETAMAGFIRITFILKSFFNNQISILLIFPVVFSKNGIKKGFHKFIFSMIIFESIRAFFNVTKEMKHQF